MRILHFYPKDNDLAAQYVKTLCEAMASYADVRAESQLAAFKKMCKEMRPHIVHLHGCWRWAGALAMDYALRGGARIVFSPHGGLEPWVVKQHFWKEKLPKLALYQRRILRRSFAVVAMGRMEAASLSRTKLNPRIETVRNAVTTSTITPVQMAEKVMDIYKKVLDSFTYPLMASHTTMALRAFIKAGQTGDAHWLDNSEYQATQELQPSDWRQLLLFAHQEGIGETVSRGIAAVGCEVPTDIDPQTIAYYSPTLRHKKAEPLHTQGSDDLERLTHAFVSAHKLLRGDRLTLAHIVALGTLIRQSQADEERLTYRINTHSILPFARRLMAVMESLTGLEEGLMPLQKKEGKKTRRILTRITNYNEIL